MKSSTSKKWYQRKIIVIPLGVFLFIMVLGAIFGGPKQKEQDKSAISAPVRNQTQTPRGSEQEVETTKPVEPTVPKYTIVHEVSGKRADGGKVYYVQIDPVNLDNDSFKDQIKTIVSDVVKQKGDKITVELHDNADSLAVSYKQYGDNSLGRPRTERENQTQARHYVASFAGQLKSDVYNNTLSFFPAAFTDNAEVGKYVKTEEFNP